MEETKKYVNLYSLQETIDADLKTIISNAPRLTEDDREITEGEITHNEALAAVSTMKSNKSPDSDGYTS